MGSNLQIVLCSWYDLHEFPTAAIIFRLYEEPKGNKFLINSCKKNCYSYYLDRAHKLFVALHVACILCVINRN